MNEKLGNRIKELRSAKQFTQEQIAEQIGVSRQKYARIESGVNSVTLDILSKIAAVLDVTVGDITKVLRMRLQQSSTEQEKSTGLLKIFDMLDLFYANKHVCEKLQHKDMI